MIFKNVLGLFVPFNIVNPPEYSAQSRICVYSMESLKHHVNLMGWIYAAAVFVCVCLCLCTINI